MRKSLFFGLVAVLSLFGCSRNQEIDVPDANLSLFARTESPTESRTVVESGVHVFWEPGDEIAVFTGELSAKFTTDITSSSASATFKGTFGDSSWPEDMDLWAVYPFSEDAVFDGETITTTLPSEQVAREGSFGKDMNLAIAHSNSNTLQFYNVGGGIRFSVTEEGIKKVMFEGLGGEIISGKVKIGLDENGKPKVLNVTGGSQFITLLPPSGQETFQKDTWYYIVAIPGSLEGGYQLHFTKQGSSGTKGSMTHVEIKRGIYGSIEKADNNIDYISFASVETVVDDLLNTINEFVSDDGDVSELLEQRRNELEANPIIKTLEIGDVATTLTLIDDRKIVFPYDFPSAFDDEEESANLAPPVKRVAAQQQIVKNKTAEVLRADVVIFNLFSRDSRRTNQNLMCEAIKQRFEEAGFSVCYCGYDDFTAQNVDYAIANNAMVFFSTLGNDEGTRICLGETIDDYLEKALNYTFVYSYKDEDKFKGDYHAWLEVSELMGGYTGPLAYFASCNTMKQSFPQDLNIIGWDGKNRVGQAYGLIIADYIAYQKKSFSAFKIDFLDLNGQIIDPIETKTHLVYSKSADYWLNFHNGHGAAYDDTSWYLNQWQSDLIINSPRPGSCINNISLRMGWSTTYSVDMTYRNTQGYVTDGKTTRLGDYEYYVLLTNMSELLPPDSYSSDVDLHYHLKSISSGSLRIVNNKVSYAYDGFEAGLWRIESKAANVLNGNNRVTDCSYALFSHKFKKNDGETYEFMPVPEVVTLGTMSGTNDLVLGGAVINRSLAGLETGFEYWKKNSPTNKSTIATSATYEDYFGAVLQIPDLNGEYEFRAFAKDEEGSIGYGDIMTFSSSTIPPEGTSNKIYYTTSDGSIVTPYSSVCSANIVSNVYSDGKGVITFDSAVTSINDYAFYECSTLTSITIPDGVKSIGYCSFLGCTGLTSISLPDGMISIGCAAFYECISLASIAIPKTVTSIGEGVSIYGVFERCRSLTSITIPEGVTTIEENTFEDCFSLRHVSIPEGVTRIGGWAFWACSFSYLKLPESLRVIGEEAFLNSDLTSITIPEGVTSIEAGAFMEGYHLTSIKILAAVPPTGGADMFRDSYCPIYVPAGSVEAYKTAEFWNNYADRIKPIGGGAFDDDDTYWVDLGLSVKWARFNLGALGEMDYGDYFAWGEITPNKSSFSWETYRWSNGDESSLTKYNYSDGINSLDYEDDPAYQQTGGNWRMPTEAEWRELIENCSWHFNGVYMEGCSNVDGYDAYIYFPLAGKKDGIEWLNDDTVGYYWTSSLSPFSSMGSIGCISTTTQDMGYLERYIGLPIRPVYDGK